MGILSRLFGKNDPFESLPLLDEASPASRALAAVRPHVGSLMQQVKDPIEVVPEGPEPVIIVGEPPEHFGVLWVEDGQLVNFKTVIEQKGLDQQKLMQLVSQLSASYRESSGAPRHRAEIGGRSVMVTSSDTLGADLISIVRTMA